MKGQAKYQSKEGFGEEKDKTGTVGGGRLVPIFFNYLLY